MATVGDSKESHVPFKEFFNIINNELVGTDQLRHAINPANGQPNPAVTVSREHHLDSAVEAAQKAFRDWSKVPIVDRRSIIHSFLDGLEAQKDAFAKQLTLEQGKPLSQAVAEIERVVSLARGLISMEIPETVLEESSDRKIIQRYVPLGVVGAIAPWNYPILLSMTKIVPAVYTGNAIILKPSPFTPYTGLKLAELASAYFPPGVVQALSGDDSLGPMMTEHPLINKISLTGSINTGKRVMASCAKTLKRVTLELGGNDAAIVCDDVDIDVVVPKVSEPDYPLTQCRHESNWLTSGYTLAYAHFSALDKDRLYVHESIYDEFRDKFLRFVRTMKMGDGTHPDVFLGPLQNEVQYEKAKDILTSISSAGLSKALNGGPSKDFLGFSFAPVIVDNPPDDSRIVSEEPFSPMIPLLKWSESDRVNVIDRVNDTETGLGASVWSKNPDQATAMAKKLEAGTVWVNSHFELVAHVPFGGHKSSGIGKEYGLSGLTEYCNSQSLWIRF